MPTVLRIGPFRFHFYANEGTEPAHIHVENGDGECKFWLDPIQLDDGGSVRARDLRQIERLIREHHQTLIEAWHAFQRRR